MDDDKRKKRYVIAVLSGIGLLGVVFVVVPVLLHEDLTWHSVFLNVGTELLGAAVVYLLLMFYMLQDWKLSEDVKSMNAKIESMRSWNVTEHLKHIDTRLSSLESPSALSFFVERPNLDARIRDASRIDLCGVTLATTLNRHRTRLLERFKAGAEIRLLVIDSRSAAVLTATQKGGSISDEYYPRRLSETDEHITWLYNEVGQKAHQSSASARTGSLEVRCLPYVPSFRIDSFGARDVEDITEDPSGLIFVEVYPHLEGDDDPPIFDLTFQEDGDWYKYFINQFEVMWGNATLWQTPRQRLTIETARYGALDRWNDVAQFLRERVSAEGLEVRVANDILGGDPIPGTRKKLKVAYKYDGESKSMELDEGHMLRLP